MNDLCVNSIVGCRDYSARVVMVMIAQAREASSTARRGQSAARRTRRVGGARPWTPQGSALRVFQIRTARWKSGGSDITSYNDSG